MRPNFKRLYAHLSSACDSVGAGIAIQTRSAAVTHGLEKKTDGYLGIFNSLVLFFIEYADRTGRLVLAWGRSHDARRPTPQTRIYTAAISRWKHILALTAASDTPGTKTRQENVPKRCLRSSPILFSKANCGQKKRGSGAQKGEKSLRILLLYLTFFSFLLPNANLIILFYFQTMKPLMEKRRRARINDSLNHLKNLILPLTGRDVSYLVSICAETLLVYTNSW